MLQWHERRHIVKKLTNTVPITMLPWLAKNLLFITSSASPGVLTHNSLLTDCTEGFSKLHLVCWLSAPYLVYRSHTLHYIDHCIVVGHFQALVYILWVKNRRLRICSRLRICNWVTKLHYNHQIHPSSVCWFGTQENSNKLREKTVCTTQEWSDHNYQSIMQIL